MRLLVIATRHDYRLLVRKHVEIEWPDVVVVEHALGIDPALDQDFAAVGFDSVIIVAAPPTAVAANFALGQAGKREFAPIVLLLLEDAPNPQPAPAPGLHRLYGRKLDRERLVKLIKTASGEHRQALAMLRASPGFENRYRFGSVVIRGHRCIRQVGSGGMCKIYLAESERAGTLVVLKVFSQVPDVSERFVGFDRFLQEYEIVAGLKHKNIVQIYDLGVADDHAYIAMEHFPAGDLRERMKQPMMPAMALKILEQIASALEAIHSVGVLHRDLKPANVMLRVDGSLCLIDFGLAKANETEASLTGTREIFGTPYYMSPEQGHAEIIDARSDLYSVGVVFYEMLIGRKPFTGSTAMEVIYKHKRADIPEIAPQFAKYEALLRRLLAKAPESRFQSAAELLTAIAALKNPV
ncbi:MAG TPA: serine/threonine-protein kinase [Steroidobacteraceae bacterium]|nr:serine/threonine-protein kinase [Steroidobacteraceae bacterium]